MDLNTISVIVTMVVSALGIVWYVQRRMDRMEDNLRKENSATRVELLGAVAEAKGEAAVANKELRVEFMGALDKVWRVLNDLRERVSRIEGLLSRGESRRGSAEPSDEPCVPLLEAPAELKSAPVEVVEPGPSELEG